MVLVYGDFNHLQMFKRIKLSTGRSTPDIITYQRTLDRGMHHNCYHTWILTHCKNVSVPIAIGMLV